MSWRDRAACAGLPTEVFYLGPGNGPRSTQVQAAKQVCAGCPVTASCLAAAMEFEAGNDSYRHGIWGGLTPEERRRLARRPVSA